MYESKRSKWHTDIEVCREMVLRSHEISPPTRWQQKWSHSMKHTQYGPGSLRKGMSAPGQGSCRDNRSKLFEQRVQVVEERNMYQGHKYIKRKPGARHSFRSRIAPFRSQKYTQDKESSTRNKLTSCQSHQECHRKRSHLQFVSRRRLGRPTTKGVQGEEVY